MKILDCETIETTYKSLENILGITKAQLKSIFDATGIKDGYYKREELFSEVKQKATSTEFDCVCWFHATRVPVSVDFAQGILPLNEAIKSVWDFLYSLIKDDFSIEEWNSFKEYMNSAKVSNENNYCDRKLAIFQLKSKKQYLCGPYATLIKDCILSSSEVGYHKYLEKSEIIEDIYICFECIYEYNLKERYQANSRPCIVKFKNQLINENNTDESKNKEKYLTTAVYYLYSHYKNNGIDRFHYSDFDNKGNRVKTTDIISIDCIEN